MPYPARDSRKGSLVSNTEFPATDGYLLTTMAERLPPIHEEHTTVEEAIAGARIALAEATTHTVHLKTLVVVFDAQRRILWAAASDGWETDYRPGSSPEMH
jgi:hypothetical protein